MRSGRWLRPANFSRGRRLSEGGPRGIVTVRGARPEAECYGEAAGGAHESGRLRARLNRTWAARCISLWWAEFGYSSPSKSSLFLLILFSTLSPNLNLNSNLNSSFYGSSPQIIFMRLNIPIFENLILLSIFLYHFSSPHFQNPIFNLGFNSTSSNYYSIIFILSILFNAQTYRTPT
jgi:hypothetical protein